MGEFSEKVFEAVRRVPCGKVATYGQIARMIGSPRSARYVGFALRANPAPGIDPKSIPCHRIVFKDGCLTDGYAFGGPDEQRRMLEAEEVAFTEDGRVDMDSCLWDGSDAPAVAEAAGNMPVSLPEGFDWKRELGEE